MAVRIPFPLPAVGYALNSKVRVNLDFLVDQFNQFNTGSATWDQVAIGTANNLTGSLTFYNASNAYYLTFKPGVTAANTTYTFPNALPTVSGSLHSNSTGTLTWEQSLKIADSPTFNGLTLTSLNFPADVFSALTFGTTSPITILTSTHGTNHFRVNLTPGGPYFILGMTQGVMSVPFSVPSLILPTSTDGTDTITLISPATIASSYTLTLPDTAGTDGYVLKTDGSGTTSWYDVISALATKLNLSGGTLTGTLVTDHVHIANAKALKFFEATGNGTESVTISCPSGGAITTSYHLYLPAAQGTATYVLQNDGTGQLGWVDPTTFTPAGGATVALDNLASVAINSHLLPGVAGTIDLGSTAKFFANAHISGIVLRDSDVGANAITIIGPAGVTSHTLTLPGTQGAANTVLTNNGSGVLSWSAVTSGASTTLDNLGITAVNNSITPATDNTILLGSATKTWSQIYATGLFSVDASFSDTLSLLGGTGTGKLTINATASAGNYTTLVTNASQAAARTYTIPDAGADASFVMTAGTQTISGTKTFDGQLIGKGTVTNNSAAAGYIGEYVESVITVASAVSSTGTGQFFSVTSISLTAGDWDISTFVTGGAAGTTTTEVFSGVGTADGNDATGINQATNAGYGHLPTAAYSSTMTVSNYRVSISSTTTYYLKGYYAYTGTAPKMYGRISARRVR